MGDGRIEVTKKKLHQKCKLRINIEDERIEMKKIRLEMEIRNG